MRFGPLKCERPHCYRHIFTSEKLRPDMQEASNERLWAICHTCGRLNSSAPLPLPLPLWCGNPSATATSAGPLVFKQPFGAYLQYPRVVITCRLCCQQSVKSLYQRGATSQERPRAPVCKLCSPHYCVPLTHFLLPFSVSARNRINFPAAAIYSPVKVMKRLRC